jgi:hypothetical protein
MPAAASRHGVSPARYLGDSALLLFRAADERLYAQKLIRSRLSEAEVVDLPSQSERSMLRALRA